jgi:hypothetical protein
METSLQEPHNQPVWTFWGREKSRAPSGIRTTFPRQFSLQPSNCTASDIRADLLVSSTTHIYRIIVNRSGKTAVSGDRYLCDNARWTNPPLQQVHDRRSFYPLMWILLLLLAFTTHLRVLASSLLRFLDHTRNDTTQSVGLLWTSDQPVAETST